MSIFITGEKIDLCIPEDKDFPKWANWFNDGDVTRYLEQGKYPNTLEQQKKFYQDAISSGRFICLIKDKNSRLLGVISLSEINYEKSSCQISLVCPEVSATAKMAPLEAMALCSQHAFERFGLSKVWAGQAYPDLIKWGQRLEILGFKTDGIIRNGFKHGRVVGDSASIFLDKDTYLKLISKRSKSLWPGEAKACFLWTRLRKESPLSVRVDLAIREINKIHDEFMDRIEIEDI